SHSQTTYFTGRVRMFLNNNTNIRRFEKSGKQPLRDTAYLPDSKQITPMHKRLLLAFAMLYGLNLRAQLFIDNGYTVDQMIHGFFDSSGVTISNLQYTGSPVQLAFFEGSQSNIGLNAGFLMATGNAENAIGPNNSPNESTAVGGAGTPWLSSL